MAADGPVPGTAGVRGFTPCFPVRDMRAALAHYKQLGFEVMPYTEGMNWAWARLGPAELHLFVKDDHDSARTAAAADLQVENADELGRVLRETAADGQATRTTPLTGESSSTSTPTTTSCDSSPRVMPDQDR